MGVTSMPIATAMTAASGGLRLDPRFHSRRNAVQPFLDGIRATAPLASMATGIANGLNLPRNAYGESDSPTDAVYASVASISSFHLRLEACSNITIEESGCIHGSRFLLSSSATTEGELLVTRSGTPGIAWPGSLCPPGLSVIPSGFLLRITAAAGCDPAYLAAILNHPAWRLISSGLAAGKRQDNLSQEQLGSIPIPIISSSVAREIGSRYVESLSEIEAAFQDDGAFSRACDAIMADVVGVRWNYLKAATVSTRSVSPIHVSRTANIRLDNRWHGPRNTYARSVLLSAEHLRLRDLLRDPIVKGRQPLWPSEDEATDDIQPAVATISIQNGRIVPELVKGTLDSSIERFPVEAGELLVAMDGDGSLGKAAVYWGRNRATADSHVARCRLDVRRVSTEAVSCFLNSSWGRSQTEGRMTGATGQTQLTPEDLSEVLLPAKLLERSTEIADRYRAASAEYAPAPVKARQLVALGALETSNILTAVGALDLPEGSHFLSYEGLYGYLQHLYPSFRQM